jgi:hypothetical protein
MMCCEQKRGKAFWIKRAIFIPIAIVAGVFVFGSVVMLLWNGILPAVLGVKVITFWQALGILVLSKILFGGFKGGHGYPKSHHGHPWMNKWKDMPTEEREKMRSEWMQRCSHQPKQEE